MKKILNFFKYRAFKDLQKQGGSTCCCNCDCLIDVNVVNSDGGVVTYPSIIQCPRCKTIYIVEWGFFFDDEEGIVAIPLGFETSDTVFNTGYLELDQSIKNLNEFRKLIKRIKED